MNEMRRVGLMGKEKFNEGKNWLMWPLLYLEVLKGHDSVMEQIKEIT